MWEHKNIVQIGQYSYMKDQVLGKGATGTVYKGFIRQSSHPIAVKVIRLSEVVSRVKKHLLACQIEALSHISCKYVVETYRILKDDEFYFIPMKYYPNGTLRSHIKAKKCLDVDEALALFTRIVEGYRGIKEENFIHRDLKTENILLSSTFDPVIIDFGYCERANTQDTKLNYNVGSPGYMAPEAYLESSYSEKSDIWAMGVILHEMLTGSILYIDRNNVEQHFKFLKLMNNADISQSLTHPFCRKLLLHMLAIDPAKRPTTEELLGMLRERPRADKNLSLQLSRVPSVQSPNNSFHHSHKQENYSHTCRNFNTQLNYKTYQKTQPSFQFDKKQSDTSNKGFQKLHKHLQYIPTLQTTQTTFHNENISFNHSLSPSLENFNYCFSPKLIRQATNHQYSFKKQKNPHNPEMQKMFANKTITPPARQRTQIITNQSFFRPSQTQRLKLNSSDTLQKFQPISSSKKFQSSVEKIKPFSSVEIGTLIQTQR